MSKEERKYKTVLISRFSALGDVAISIPVIYSVCEANPDTRFVMLTRPVSSRMFVNHPSNLEVLGIKLEEYEGVKGLWNLGSRLIKEYHPDAYVDLHGVLRTHLLALRLRMSGIEVEQIEKGRKGKRALTRRHNKRLFPLTPSWARYREVFHRLGFNFEFTFKSVFGGCPADFSEYSDIISSPKGDETWIAVAPYAKHPGKIYPVDKMRSVVETLAKRKGYRIFLLGNGQEEIAVLGKWAREIPNVQSLAGYNYGFRKELALMSNCDAMISMDSANMHLASLVNLPVVSIWGATHPYCGFMGWQQNEENAVQLNLTCRPCSVFGNKPCHNADGNYFCLSGISPDLIIMHLDKVLQKR